MTADVVVLGGGVIGCAVARVLAREGVSVVVVDRDQPGRHASWAAAGMLAPQAEADGPDPFLDLLLRARSLFPGLAAELKAETGLDVGYRTEGMLHLSFDEAGDAALRARAGWQRSAGLEVEALSGDEARRLEPAISPGVRTALFFPGDHQVDNRLLVRALWFSAHAAGARFVIGHAARRIAADAGGIRVDLENGASVAAATVVLAAGSWSGSIEGLPRTVPVEPVHGQLIALDTAPPVLRHIVASGHGYLVPRADGRLIVGATAERIGFHAAVTTAGLRHLTGVATALVPELASRAVLAHWCGLRPGTPDGRPILGRDPDLPSLVHATGHFRNGILLAPITAEVVRDVVLGRQPVDDPSPYRPDRFDGG